MPTGPEGQKRPADVIANAVHVAKIATGEATETNAKRAQPETRQKGADSGPDAGDRRGQPPCGWLILKLQ